MANAPRVSKHYIQRYCHIHIRRLWIFFANAVDSSDAVSKEMTGASVVESDATMRKHKPRRKGKCTNVVSARLGYSARHHCARLQAVIDGMNLVLQHFFETRSAQEVGKV